jgi:hypothetical protein
MTDDEFLDAFERCTLTRSDWTHAAHVRMAWLYLSRTPDFEDALARIRAGIQRLNAQFGTAPDKYHDTITVAYAALVRDRIDRVGDCTWDEFGRRHPETLDWQNPLPLRHYSKDRLFSRAAYEAYIEPDIAPLPIVRAPAME